MTPTESALSSLVSLVERLQDNVRDPAMLQSIVNQGSTGHAYVLARSILGTTSAETAVESDLQVVNRVLADLRAQRDRLTNGSPAWFANVAVCDKAAVLQSRLANPEQHTHVEQGGGALSAEQLADKYGSDTSWGAHPTHSRSAWQEEVSNGDVQSGYWDWVVSQIEQEDNEDLQVEGSELDRGDSPR